RARRAAARDRGGGAAPSGRARGDSLTRLGRGPGLQGTGRRRQLLARPLEPAAGRPRLAPPAGPGAAPAPPPARRALPAHRAAARGALAVHRSVAIPLTPDALLEPLMEGALPVQRAVRVPGAVDALASALGVVFLGLRRPLLVPLPGGAVAELPLRAGERDA